MRNPKFDIGFVDFRKVLHVEEPEGDPMTPEELAEWKAEWEADMRELDEFYKAREKWEKEWWEARETPDD